ncbi:MAG: single-stranded DNA-binding protein [Acutalibacteraceae bacterium]
MLNTAILMGRLTATPELKKTANGFSVTSFTLAVNRSFVKAGAERQTDWIDVVAWNKTAEHVCKYYVKGQLMAVQGRLETRTYEDKNGVKRKVVEVIAESVHFAEPKRDSYGGGQFNDRSDENSQIPSYSNTGASDFQEITEDDEDLPF